MVRRFDDELLPNLLYEHGYAIVRVDGPADPADPDSCYNNITVKKVLKDRVEAAKEVERLNEVNSDKGCYYLAMLTRVDPDICKGAK